MHFFYVPVNKNLPKCKKVKKNVHSNIFLNKNVLKKNKNVLKFLYYNRNSLNTMTKLYAYIKTSKMFISIKILIIAYKDEY